MSILLPPFERSVVARGAAAETQGSPTAKITLLADSSATGGALSTIRVTLGAGADGARPHRHKGSAEMFYVIDGAMRVLSGSEILTVGAGDLVVVPPQLPHAFAAVSGETADVLIVVAPGIERFEYFRKLTRIARGEEALESLAEVQELYDTYFLNSPEWEAARR